MNRDIIVSFTLMLGAALCVSTAPSIAQTKCDGINERPISPFVIPRHEERYRARVDFLAHRFEESGYKVVILGDSIAQRWPHELLSRSLGGPVLNAGVGGDGVAQLLWRLENWPLQSLTPDIVLVIVGTNDIARKDSGCAVAANLKLVATKLKHVWPSSRIVFSSILPRGDHLQEYREQIVAANDWLASQASRGEFSYLDLFTPILNACGSQADCEYLERGGDVHPTVSGYEILTRKALKAIASRASP